MNNASWKVAEYSHIDLFIIILTWTSGSNSEQNFQLFFFGKNNLFGLFFEHTKPIIKRKNANFTSGFALMCKKAVYL